MPPWLAKIFCARTLHLLTLVAVLAALITSLCSIQRSQTGGWPKIHIWPFSSAPPRMMNGNGIRGIYQSPAVFAQNNNTYFPALNNAGQPLTQPASQPATAPATTQPATPPWKSQIGWDSPHPTTLTPENARKGHLMLNDKYRPVIKSDDFLFSSTQPTTQPAKTSTPSAQFGHTTQNF